MPSVDFELPHWLYWAVLAGFPLLAMILARRRQSVTAGERGYELSLAYFVLLVGGFIGLHRFYLKNIWGVIFIPLFLGILYCNAAQRDAREVYSDVSATYERAESDVERYATKIRQSEERIPTLQAAVSEAEEGSFALKSAERRLSKEQDKLVDSQERLASAEASLAEIGPDAVAEAAATRESWGQWALRLFMAILALMGIDALLMPWLKKRANEKLAEERRLDAEAESLLSAEDIAELAKHEAQERKTDAHYISTGWTGVIDRLCALVGEFVSFWAVIAVFVYFYEVVARYVFNSPTNWAHEAMFLMFGMQYLLCGAYAMLTEAHVRVDIFYANFSPRRKAMVDILTSVFFFIFAGTLMVTGWIFAMDATKVNEISFSEWAIAYWPFKWAIFLGALLLVLQGISKFAKDLRILRSGEPV